nr:uncharacterized protein C16orf78 homolog [Loxodonta africana]
MSEKAEDLKDIMPTERKSTWKTAEERRMSDLTRVLEWLERRQGKKKQAVQVGIRELPRGRGSEEGSSVATSMESAFSLHLISNAPGPQSKVGENSSTAALMMKLVTWNKSKHVVTIHKANGTEGNKTKGIRKQQQGGNRQVLFPGQVSRQSTRKNGDTFMYRRLYGVERRGKRLSMVPSNYIKDGSRKPGKGSPPEPPSSQRLQSPHSSQGSSTHGPAPKPEAILGIKNPSSATNSLYLRLSKNNIKTLLKLCKDAGMNVDIHPHMIEGDINSKMVFAQTPSTAL